MELRHPPFRKKMSLTAHITPRYILPRGPHNLKSGRASRARWTPPPPSEILATDLMFLPLSSYKFNAAPQVTSVRIRLCGREVNPSEWASERVSAWARGRVGAWARERVSAWARECVSAWARMSAWARVSAWARECLHETATLLAPSKIRVIRSDCWWYSLRRFILECSLLGTPAVGH